MAQHSIPSASMDCLHTPMQTSTLSFSLTETFRVMLLFSTSVMSVAKSVARMLVSFSIS